MIINKKKFEVASILKKKGNFMFDWAVAINEDVMLDLFGDQGTVDMISVKVKDPMIIEDVKEDIEKKADDVREKTVDKLKKRDK